MQGILSGGLLVVAFAAVAGLALLVVVRLYRVSRTGQLPAGQPAGSQPAVGQPAGALMARRRSPGPGEQPDA